MKTAIATLKSISPYSQSKNYDAAKLPRELANDFEERTWKERGHWTAEGKLFIPPMQFKNCISDAAKYLGKQVPGKGKNTYTKHFESGIIVPDALILPISKDTVSKDRVYVPSDGKRGGGKRVWKNFPLVPEWAGDVTYVIIDDIITEDVFREHLEMAGQLIGIGRWRPRNNGMFGRFSVVDMTFVNMTFVGN
jgi:hypothetical protein